MLNLRSDPLAYVRAILRGPVSIFYRGDRPGKRGWLVPSIVLQTGPAGRRGPLESRSVFVPDGNSPREGVPTALVRRAIWRIDPSFPPVPRTGDIKASGIRVAVTHSVPAESRVTKMDGAWKDLLREVGTSIRARAERGSESRQENTTIPIAKGPSYWHTVEAGGFEYVWFSGQENCPLTDAWRKLWENLAGGRKVDTFMERHQWDPLGLSMYVTPKESLKLSKWYVDRLLPVIDELCGDKV